MSPRVTFRRNTSLVWEDAFLKLPLFAFDAVKTHERASAQIRLGNGTALELGEDTLVILNPDVLRQNRVTARHEATLRGGKLRGKTNEELWLLTSAAVMKIWTKQGGRESIVSLSVKEGGKFRAELTSGTAKILTRPNEGTKVEIRPLVPEKAVEFEAPVVKESLDWAPDELDKLEQENDEQLLPLPIASPRIDFEVTSPKNHSTVDKEEVEIRGKLTGMPREVLVNGKKATISKKREFIARIPLKPGVNAVLVQVIRPSGESVFQRWVVRRSE